jgi:hypothetical protein
LRAGNTPKRQGAVVSDEAIHARRAPARDVGRACIGVAWIATGLAALAMTMNRGRPRDDGEVGLVPPVPVIASPEGAWQSMPFGRRAAVLGGGGASTGAGWIATGLRPSR